MAQLNELNEHKASRMGESDHELQMKKKWQLGFAREKKVDEEMREKSRNRNK